MRHNLPTPQPLLVTFGYAAALLSMSVREIERLCDEGALTRNGKRKRRRITMASLEAYAKSEENSHE